MAAEPMGFFTDTTVCIGCKACEVACKQWNALPATNGGRNTLSGMSYDNTRRLDGEHWRHVQFIEQFNTDRSQGKTSAYIYGKEDMLGGLNSFFLLTDQPEVYGLPAHPRLASVNSVPSWLFSAGSAIVAAILGVIGFRKARMDAIAHGTPEES